MGGALALALVEQYGPALVGLCLRYGPTVLAWIEDAQAKGTLDADIKAIGAELADLVSGVKSLSDLAEVLTPVDGGNPTPEEDVRARPDKRGGR